MVRTPAGHLSAAVRVLVTGSRGKSSLVRLIFTAFQACGLDSHARITGVLPRHLYGQNARVLLRLNGGHVEETRWWLKELPASAQAVVLENNAVDPFLQHLAADWLKPDLIVLTNTRADHQEVWGPGREQAAKALLAGIPEKSRVVLSSEAASQPGVAAALNKKKVDFTVAPEPLERVAGDHRDLNLALALAVCQKLGLDRSRSEKSMKALKPDLADFQIKDMGQGSSLGLGFAVNDLKSTRTAFDSLGWRFEETSLLFNHRRDRPLRLREFNPFIKKPWQKVIVIGDRPWPLPPGSVYRRLKSNADFSALFSPGNNYFGCGNLAGRPLAFLLTENSFD
ncbi:hypothetical protein [Dethiosulfatarculus sandiegensis]|uniref:Mur ligase central domain-containing protein n=1 Tax=Dethiosulfatarculus sandiegensis TaxID=1429043 RepID=A0A0D2IXL0_9BACT|nr:hypothetical protein [Dethiosulfatarculus sandiegensis]KIX10794.1 hypothetical protein X474_27755 [Dethiosulfatarculus sandiegensis]